MSNILNPAANEIHQTPLNSKHQSSGYSLVCTANKLIHRS